MKAQEKTCAGLAVANSIECNTVIIIPFTIRTTLYELLLNRAISEQTSSTLMGLARTLFMPAAR